jgi:Zn-dependent protease
LTGFDLSTVVALGVLLLVAFPVHEFAHAFIAYRLGDDTAQRAGRLTLNPLRHLDVFGTLMLILTRFIGWAKPVPVNPYNLRYGPRVGNAMVAAAGPLSNLIMATLVSIPYRLGLFNGAPVWVRDVIWIFVTINVILFIFNLIPLGPLDGYSVLMGIVGEDGARLLAPLRTYGSLILMALLMIGFLSPGLNFLGKVLGPLMDAIRGILLGV